MTFLEKTKQEHNISNEEHLITVRCPSDFGYEPKIKCKAIIGAEVKEKNYICRRCWEREMPNTESIEYCDKCGYIKEQCECEEDVSFADDLLNQGYNKGLNDAWELVRKINNMEFKEFIKVFERTGYDGREVKMHLIDELTPQEALAKLKAYEEAQIEVGDVVEMCYEDEEEKPFKGVVLESGMNGFVTIFDKNANVRVWEIEKLKKTGKHLDISSILEQIGE